MSVPGPNLRAMSCRASSLWVDPIAHAGEVARFRSKVVVGPDEGDCSIWVGSIGADGYGRFFLTRHGAGFCARANRYALALDRGSIGAQVLALHECDLPVCVKVNAPHARRQHVVGGTQGDNMARMARMGRGGGRPLTRGPGRDARRLRSVALREAVRNGVWDAQAVRDALWGSEPSLF